MRMRRRDFVGLVIGAAAGPLAARAQQPARMRRIGVIMNTTADHAVSTLRVTALAQGLQDFGWTVGRNIRIDYRWGAADADNYRRHATELVALAPDVMLAANSPIVGAMLQATRTTPIVFVNVVDPVGAGWISSLARPGGNATGFTQFEYGMSAKWLELLKQVAPRVNRVAVLRDTASPSGTGQLGAIQSVAPQFGVEVSPIGMRDPAEIERGITGFVRGANEGLIVTASAPASFHIKLITTRAAQYRLPAIYSSRISVIDGGLLSYGTDVVDQYRLAASYIDRILKGEKPSDLPVQNPTKYELVLNMKTAKAIGLDVPAQVLVRADEVIECQKAPAKAGAISRWKSGPGKA
jgi:putative ABC transport system substrate-binding protein